MSVVGPDAVVGSAEELAVYLCGPAQAGFCLDLLHLLARADGQQRCQLRWGFPRETLAWEVWSALDDHPTAAQLTAKIEAAVIGDASRQAWTARLVADLFRAYLPDMV